MKNYTEAPDGYEWRFSKCVRRKGKLICAKKGKYLKYLVKINK